jgi:hypothetical protein
MKQPPVTTPQALLQVAIPIALPSPRRQSMGDSEKGYLNSDEGFEYSIGLVDLPWHAESLTGGMND